MYVQMDGGVESKFIPSRPLAKIKCSICSCQLNHWHVSMETMWLTESLKHGVDTHVVACCHSPSTHPPRLALPRGWVRLRAPSYYTQATNTKKLKNKSRAAHAVSFLFPSPPLSFLSFSSFPFPLWHFNGAMIVPKSFGEPFFFTFPWHHRSFCWLGCVLCFREQSKHGEH